jgi:hypothetical protein
MTLAVVDAPVPDEDMGDGGDGGGGDGGDGGDGDGGDGNGTIFILSTLIGDVIKKTTRARTTNGCPRGGERGGGDDEDEDGGDGGPGGRGERPNLSEKKFLRTLVVVDAPVPDKDRDDGGDGGGGDGGGGDGGDGSSGDSGDGNGPTLSSLHSLVMLSKRPPKLV